MRSILVLLASVLAFASAAQSSERITTKEEFVGAVAERELTMFAISVRVTPDGGIDGSAYGSPVTGRWDWQDGFFCRDLYWGDRDLGANCQAVYLEGDKVRFTSDRGAGRTAALQIN